MRGTANNKRSFTIEIVFFFKMEGCETTENCRNNSIMNDICNEDKVSPLPMLSTPSNSKRKTTISSALRSSRPSARKLRKIDENVGSSFNADENSTKQTEVCGETVMTVMEMNNRIKQLYSDNRVLLLVSHHVSR